MFICQLIFEAGSRSFKPPYVVAESQHWVQVFHFQLEGIRDLVLGLLKKRQQSNYIIITTDTIEFFMCITLFFLQRLFLPVCYSTILKHLPEDPSQKLHSIFSSCTDFQSWVQVFNLNKANLLCCAGNKSGNQIISFILGKWMQNLPS